MILFNEPWLVALSKSDPEALVAHCVTELSRTRAPKGVDIMVGIIDDIYTQDRDALFCFLQELLMDVGPGNAAVFWHRVTAVNRRNP